MSTPKGSNRLFGTARFSLDLPKKLGGNLFAFCSTMTVFRSFLFPIGIRDRDDGGRREQIRDLKSKVKRDLRDTLQTSSLRTDVDLVVSHT
jgi:hypothetical protein